MEVSATSPPFFSTTLRLGCVADWVFFSPSRLGASNLSLINLTFSPGTPIGHPASFFTPLVVFFPNFFSTEHSFFQCPTQGLFPMCSIVLVFFPFSFPIPPETRAPPPGPFPALFPSFFDHVCITPCTFGFFHLPVCFRLFPFFFICPYR